MLFDTHVHLSLPENDFEFKEKISNELKGCLNISAQTSDFLGIIKDFEAFKNIYPVIGVYPQYNDAFDEDLLIKYADKACCIGEIGIDKYFGNIEKQKEIFESQLIIAKEYDLPVIIHQRKALNEVIESLKKYGINKVEFHGFTGSKESVGYILKNVSEPYFGIGMTILNGNAKRLNESLAYIPQDKLLLETDSPYMKANYTKSLIKIADKVSDVLNLKYESVLETNLNNVRKFLYKEV